MRSRYLLLPLMLLSSALACSDDEGRTPDRVGDSEGAVERGDPESETSDATYSVAETCELFANALCARGAECGVTIGETDGELICLDCESGFRELMAASCEEDLTENEAAAAVDRCIASISAAPCGEICSEGDIPNCEVLDELLASEEEAEEETSACNAACASD